MDFVLVQHHATATRCRFKSAIIFVLLVASLAITGCAGADSTEATASAPTPAPSPLPTLPSNQGETTVMETPTAVMETPTAVMETPTAVPVSPGLLSVPAGWYSTPIELTDGSGVLFVRQDPAVLAAFDDPSLAVPADFAGGALIITPLPGDADPVALENDMAESLSLLGDQDFEAMLAGADQVGLINLAAVEFASLLQARVESDGDSSAILLEGTVHFRDRPPPLHGKIWLSWNRESFVVLYALAAEMVWHSVSADFDGVRRSLHLP